MSREEQIKLRNKWGVPFVRGPYSNPPGRPAAAKPAPAPTPKQTPAAPSRNSTAMIARFPKTMEGITAFIKAWNSSADGAAFVSKYGNGSSDFWGASAARASFLRKHQVKLKHLKKSRGEGGIYDFEVLRAVAAECMAN